MTKIYFDNSVDEKILSELDKAEQYIRIAMFQIHSDNVFDLLSAKLKKGISVDIFTLPFDSINEEVKNRVVQNFEKLEKLGAKIFYCKWNVGNPERTTTAIGRWYSFHGKFIITEKCAIILSSNFTGIEEFDAAFLYINNKEKIDNFNKKFDWLIDFFINKYNSYEGKLHQEIKKIDNDEDLFALPRVIETSTHRKNWIKHYPNELLNISDDNIEGLIIGPFDGKVRELFNNIINQANKYIYISTESFTDYEFATFLGSIRHKDKEIKILSGATSMDFQDRMQNMIRELLSRDIQFRTIEGDLHAKLLITDKAAIISSVNLNKMNLGFSKTSRYWRANTESLMIERDKHVIEKVSSLYNKIFANATPIEEKLLGKLTTVVSNLVTKSLDLRSKSETKLLLAKLILEKEIDVKRFMFDLGVIIFRLMTILQKQTVEKEQFLLSLTLYYLTEKEHDIKELDEKLKALDTEYKLNDLLNLLTRMKLIEKSGNHFRFKTW